MGIPVHLGKNDSSICCFHTSFLFLPPCPGCPFHGPSEARAPWVLPKACRPCSFSTLLRRGLTILWLQSPQPAPLNHPIAPPMKHRQVLQKTALLPPTHRHHQPILVHFPPCCVFLPSTGPLKPEARREAGCQAPSFALCSPFTSDLTLLFLHSPCNSLDLGDEGSSISPTLCQACL